MRKKQLHVYTCNHPGNVHLCVTVDVGNVHVCIYNRCREVDAHRLMEMITASLFFTRSNGRTTVLLLIPAMAPHTNAFTGCCMYMYVHICMHQMQTIYIYIYTYMYMHSLKSKHTYMYIQMYIS